MTLLVSRTQWCWWEIWHQSSSHFWLIPYSRGASSVRYPKVNIIPRIIFRASWGEDYMSNLTNAASWAWCSACRPSWQLHHLHVPSLVSLSREPHPVCRHLQEPSLPLFWALRLFVRSAVQVSSQGWQSYGTCLLLKALEGLPSWWPRGLLSLLPCFPALTAALFLVYAFVLLQYMFLKLPKKG